jgi:hypothetical protein
MKARVFVGSSTEGLDVAYAIQSALAGDAETTVWSQGIFEPQQYYLEALLAALPEFDLAVFVFTLDDLSIIRDTKQQVVRDNVIFELGMFLGRLGRSKCFMVMPHVRGVWHLPTDLLGLAPLTFDPNRTDGRLDAALGPACNEIRKVIKKHSSAAATPVAAAPQVLLPGNAGLYQKAYRDFERIVLASLKSPINEHTPAALQAARTDAENRTFQKAPRAEYVEPLKQELDEIFSRVMETILSMPASEHTTDFVRVVMIGRSNAFFKLEQGSGSEEHGGVVA